MSIKNILLLILRNNNSDDAVHDFTMKLFAFNILDFFCTYINFIYMHNKSTELPARIFAKLSNSQQQCVNLSHNEFRPSLSRNIEKSS